MSSAFSALVEEEGKVRAGLVALRFAGSLEEQRVEGSFEDGLVALDVEQAPLSQSEDRWHARLLLFLEFPSSILTIVHFRHKF